MCKVYEEYGDKRFFEGREETNAANIKNLMETLNFSFDQAVAALKIPEADRSRYAQALANR